MSFSTDGWQHDSSTRFRYAFSRSGLNRKVKSDGQKRQEANVRRPYWRCPRLLTRARRPGEQARTGGQCSGIDLSRWRGRTLWGQAASRYLSDFNQRFRRRDATRLHLRGRGVRNTRHQRRLTRPSTQHVLGSLRSQECSNRAVDPAISRRDGFRCASLILDASRSHACNRRVNLLNLQLIGKRRRLKIIRSA